MELFLKPDEEDLVARDGQDVSDIVGGLSPERGRSVGAAALRRVRADHTYAHRAVLADQIFRRFAKRSMVEAAE
jgi:spore maturation protein CgeB